MTDTADKKTALYNEHVRLGAKIIPFGGWLMPVQYTSIVDEHQTVRRDVGMFDISHMGQFLVRGDEASAWLNEMLTNNIDKLGDGQGQYTFLLNERGGVIDDLIAYRIRPDEFLLVVNASKIDEDFAGLENHRKSHGSITLVNRSADYGAVAIQGPRTAELFKALLSGNGELPARNRLADLKLDGNPVSVARTGYTGEDGVEVFFRATDAAKIWTLF